MRHPLRLAAVNGTYRFGRFELNATTRQVLADGAPMALGARALDVLVALVERNDRVVSKDELLQLAWPGVVVEALGGAASRAAYEAGYALTPKQAVAEAHGWMRKSAVATA